MTIATEPPEVLNYDSPRRAFLLDVLGGYKERFDRGASIDEVTIDLMADLTHLYLEWLGDQVGFDSAEQVTTEVDDLLSAVALHVTEESPLLVEY